jgi:NADP-dependent 3-hydroxy acid dehydrogenase YdfG
MKCAQSQIGSGFDSHRSAADEIAGLGLTGKNLEMTRALAHAGATVIVPARSVDKAVRELHGVPRTRVAKLDLLDPASIKALQVNF